MFTGQNGILKQLFRQQKILLPVVNYKGLLGNIQHRTKMFCKIANQDNSYFKVTNNKWSPYFPLKLAFV